MNYYKSKNQKQRYKIIKLLHKAIAKRPIKNPKKSPGIEFVLLSYPGKMIMDNFGCLKSLLFFFYFYLVMNLQKKSYGVHKLTAKALPLPI